MKKLILSGLMAVGLVFATAQQSAQADSVDRTIGTLIGAVGGGILGSTLGKGKGRVVATAAGTVIGAAIGREIATDRYEDDWRRERDHRPAKRVVYREVEPERVVIVKEKRKPLKKWKRVARYGDDVIVCNKNGKRCHWAN